MELFAAYGYQLSNIIPLTPPQLSGYSTASGTLQKLALTPSSTFYDNATAWQIPAAIQSHYPTSTTTYPGGVGRSAINIQQATRFVKFYSSPTLYYLDTGTKRPIYSYSLFQSLGGSLNNLMILSDSSAGFFVSTHVPIGTNRGLASPASMTAMSAPPTVLQRR